MACLRLPRWNALKQKSIALVLLLILFTGIASSFPVISHAQTPPFSQTNVSQYLTPNVDSNVSQDQHTFVQAIFIESLSAIVCQLDGTDPINPSKGCLGIDPVTHKLGYAPPAAGQVGGLLGITTNSLASLYHPPLSSTEYTRYLSDNFGIRKADAASATNGTGFETLSPLLKMWVMTRNIAYLFLVIAFIVIGFMIMLRVKIDPRTVMTIQNQIPRIIIGILLITFSYAIAGLLVDAMWVTTYFTINLLSTVTDPTDKPYINTDAATSQLLAFPINYINATWSYGGGGGVLGTGVANGGILSAAGNIGTSFQDIITGLINDILQVNDGSTCSKDDPLACARLPFEIIIGFIFKLIVLVALLLSLFRVWYALIKGYVFILLDTATAPLWIIAGVIPGSSFGFIPWLRHMLAHLTLFPATVAMFLAAFILANTMAGSGTNLFVPPLVGGNPAHPADLGWLIAFGMIMLTPELLNMLRNAFKSPTKQYGGIMAAGLRAGAGPVGALTGYTMGRFWRPAGYGNAGWLRSKVVGHLDGDGNAVGRARILEPLIGGIRRFNQYPAPGKGNPTGGGGSAPH